MMEAATLGDGGCNHVSWRLQPCFAVAEKLPHMWRRYKQQWRAQLEREINSAIDAKQKALADLHMQPERATGHAVIVFQLQEIR